MNIVRIAVLGIAFAAAGTAALLVRGGMGGAKKNAVPPAPVAITEEVLVASKDITVGRNIDATLVRWEAWPKASVTAAYIIKSKQPDLAKAVTGVVARAPLMTGQPVTDANTVKASATGFMAATITPGLRAIAVPVSPETGAGGFILPNDRVDIV